MNLREKSRMPMSMLMNTCFFGHHFPHKDRDPDQGTYKAAPQHPDGPARATAQAGSEARAQDGALPQRGQNHAGGLEVVVRGDLCQAHNLQHIDPLLLICLEPWTSRTKQKIGQQCEDQRFKSWDLGLLKSKENSIVSQTGRPKALLESNLQLQETHTPLDW